MSFNSTRVRFLFCLDFASERWSGDLGGGYIPIGSYCLRRCSLRNGVDGAMLRDCPIFEQEFVALHGPDGFIKAAIVADIHLCATVQGVRGQLFLYGEATAARAEMCPVCLLAGKRVYGCFRSGGRRNLSAEITHVHVKLPFLTGLPRPAAARCENRNPHTLLKSYRDNTVTGLRSGDQAS